MTTLRELTSNYKQLQFMLEALAERDDIESEDYQQTKQAILDTMESIEPVLEDKVDGYCTIINDIYGDIEKVNNEIKRLQGRKKTMENSIEWLKANLMYSMKMQNKDKVKTPFHSVTISKNGSRKLTLKVEEKELPPEYVNIIYKADSKAIKDMLKEDGIEENAWCKLEPFTESLRIR